MLKRKFPHFEIPKPKAVQSGSDTVCVTMEFSSKDWEKVQALMAHFSHSVPDQKLESLLLYWCNQVQKKKQKQCERIEKAEWQPSIQNQNFEIPTNIQDKNSKVPASIKNTNSETPAVIQNEDLSANEISPPLRRRKHALRTKASVKVRMQLGDRAQDQCEYVSSLTGKRCNCRVFLENAHIIPLAKGGSHSPINLRLFCRSHNQLMAKVWGLS